MILIISGDTETSDAVYDILHADKCREVKIVYDPTLLYNSYTASLFSKKPFKSGLPNEILRGKLFLGNEEHARSREVVNALGITHIVNATKTIPNEFKKVGVSYIRVDVDDTEDDPLYEHFDKVYEFVF
jgi:hypothetical protein